MNIIRKSIAVFGLAAIAFGAFVTIPTNAQGPAPAAVKQVRKAGRLDRQANRAAVRGNYRRATRLRHRATRLRHGATQLRHRANNGV